MRDILFRGKRIDTGEWVEGCLFYDPDLEEAQITGFEYYNGETGLERDQFCERVDPDTVGQYTGMEDTNGKKIFEGDIVQDEDLDVRLMNDERDGARTGRGVIKYGIHSVPSDDPFCWGEALGFYIDGETLYPTLAQYHPYCIQVIGNIHDNPELMEG